MANPSTSYRRVGDYDKTFGEALDKIEDMDVFLHDYSVGLRNLTRDGVTQERPFTTLEVSETPDGPVRTYHTWSESIAEKITAIPKDELPVMAKFVQVTTGAGRTVWDVK